MAKQEQRAFFVSADGSRLLTHSEKGAKRIKPKEKKPVRPRNKPLTPFGEIMQLERAVRQRAKILEEYGASEDMNGNIFMMRAGQMTQIGWDEATEFLKELKSNRPDLPEIPMLSPKAFKLRYALDKKKMERGPLHGSKLPGTGDFNAFGNKIK